MWPFKSKPEPRCTICGSLMIIGVSNPGAIVDDMCPIPHDVTETYPWLFKNDSNKKGN